MNLPAIEIPIKLADYGIHLPVHLHPPIVHFAIALPVILLFIEIINLFMKRRALSITTTLLIFLIAFIFLGAYFAGKVDGKEAFAYLSSEAQEELKEHKLLGIYLVYSTGVLLLFKLIAFFVKKWWSKALYLLILLGFIAATFIQGKHGGELVYTYGANVKAVQTLEDKVEELEDQIEELKAAKAKEESDKKVTQSKESEVSTKEEAKKEEVKEENEENVQKATKENEESAKEVKKEESEPKEEVKENENANASSQNVEQKEETTNEVASKPESHEEAPAETAKDKEENSSNLLDQVKEKAKEIQKDVKEGIKGALPSIEPKESKE